MRALSFALVPIGALAVTVLPTQADTLSVRFSWAGIPACAAISPAFELGGVPVGTKRLRFTMIDLYALTFDHGGSTITYDGDSVSKGAIRYTGPCPPRGGLTIIAGRCMRSIRRTGCRERKRRSDVSALMV